MTTRGKKQTNRQINKLQKLKTNKTNTRKIGEKRKKTKQNKTEKQTKQIKTKMFFVVVEVFNLYWIRLSDYYY